MGLVLLRASYLTPCASVSDSTLDQSRCRLPGVPCVNTKSIGMRVGQIIIGG